MKVHYFYELYFRGKLEVLHKNYRLSIIYYRSSKFSIAISLGLYIKKNKILSQTYCFHSLFFERS